MKYNSRKTFIGTLFAILLLGEVSFQVFTNGERTLVNLARQEYAALDSVFIRANVVEEKARAIKRAAPLENSKAIYDSLNKRALARKELFNPYSQLIIEADKQIDEAWRPYKELISELQTPIRSEYKEHRENSESWLGQLTGIQYGISASLLAVGLAFFATLMSDAWRWILLGASFIPQFTACTMIYHGAMLKFDDVLQAASFAVMFFSCAPLAFHWGIIIYQNNGMVQAHGFTLTTTKTTHTTSLTVWSCDKDGWVKAITALARERNLGNGAGMLTEIADHFEVNKGVVSRAVGLAMSGKPINVPRKFLPLKRETVA